MDKYEYNLKLEEIDKLVDQGDYEEAAKLADTVDWRRVRNIRTLCLISEIYEASGRLEDSKTILVRAYKKSPVGKTILYRLVEVTTALQQYDEAIEYYSEYVQAAPHDNNRYILKYLIYRGRGSSVEELITILEEYLGQEYTERWAYELARLYQQAGQMQKCFAACDDVVLWFHSGKYVRKALELKKRYTSLTPRQQQIYEECLQEEMEAELEDQEEEETVLQNTEEIDGEVIAESIMAETEKEIAGEVAARKAEMEREAADTVVAADMSVREITPADPLSQETKILKTDEMKAVLQADAVKAAAGAAGGNKADRAASEPAESGIRKEAVPETAQEPQKDPQDLKVEFAKSMREIISGVVKRNMENEEDIPASVDAKFRQVPKLEIPEVEEPIAGQLSIDDILLSMSEKGKQVAAEAMRAQELREAEEAEAAKVRTAETAHPKEETNQEEIKQEEQQEQDRTVQPVKTMVDAAAEELTDAQREALQYTSNPEKLLRNKSALPTYMEEIEAKPAQEAAASDAAAVMNAGAVSETAMPTAGALAEEAERVQETVSGETMTETLSETAEAAEWKTGAASAEAAEWKTGAASGKAVKQKTVAVSEEEKTAEAVSEAVRDVMPADDFGMTRRIVTKEELLEASRKEVLAEKTIRIPAEEISRTMKQTPSESDEPGSVLESVSDNIQAEQYAAEQSVQGLDQIGADESEEAAYIDDRNDMEMQEEEPYDEEYLTIPEHLRGLFSGFTEIEGLEDQIANAIIQAESKGNDRTSRNGNILIFGAHGSGKTTLAMNIAKAVAQDKGNPVMKIAKIYAADLNRKDIAATIARIAGGTLIIEEAGDLEANTIEQLTTAMEFRTDGLIVILEDEQQYIHELLMRHPRFTMKFTAQIYIPVYTAEELAMFGQIYARAQDYVISEDGLNALYEKISVAAASGEGAAISDVIAMVSAAIANSNKFLRKMSMGKKRYDENDYVVLFAKDFK